MAGKKQNPDFSDDTDIIEGAEDLKDLGALDIDEDDEHDFDGHDAEIDFSASASEEGSSGYLGEGERVLDDDDDDEDDLDSFQYSDIEDSDDEQSTFESSSSDSGSELQVAIEQRDTYIEALRQLQADFENYKKRVVRDQQEYADLKSTKLIEDLLPVVDNFELAISSLESEDKEIKKFKKGVELVYSELVSLLIKQGLEKIDPIDEVFDPELHDAVMHEEVGQYDQEVVVEVLRQGYKIKGRVIRPAMVKVAK